MTDDEEDQCTWISPPPFSLQPAIGQQASVHAKSAVTQRGASPRAPRAKRASERASERAFVGVEFTRTCAFLDANAVGRRRLIGRRHRAQSLVLTNEIAGGKKCAIWSRATPPLRGKVMEEGEEVEKSPPAKLKLSYLMLSPEPNISLCQTN